MTKQDYDNLIAEESIIVNKDNPLKKFVFKGKDLRGNCILRNAEDDSILFINKVIVLVFYNIQNK